MYSGKPGAGTPSRGVYFLSNNKMYDFAIAFLNSFRYHNPDIPLCFIPYNKSTDRIEALKDIYRFDIFDNEELLLTCDKLSLRLHERVTSEYRKLAMWEGMFDEFIYIDVDTVVLEDVSFAFDFLKAYDFLSATSNLPHARKYVWLDGIESTGALTPTEIAYAANTGFFASKKGFMDLPYILNGMKAACKLEDYMELTCLEQPFLNYLVVKSGKRYTSLSLLAAAEPERQVMVEYWGGSTLGRTRRGRIYCKSPVFFIHWSGVWRLKEKMPNRRIWKYYRGLRLSPDTASRV